MKNLSIKERNRRKYRKMYNSLENRMQGDNLIWWNSLTMKAKYSLVFKWNSCTKNFKHFIKENKPSYRASLPNRRNAIIEHFLN
jgi:hypothetical protein